MLRVSITSFILAAGLMGSHAFAADKLSLQVIKTGILPAGGFYRIYEVACKEATNANVARLQGQGDWCVNDNGELACFSDSQQASRKACGAEAELASAEIADDTLFVN